MAKSVFCLGVVVMLLSPVANACSIVCNFGQCKSSPGSGKQCYYVSQGCRVLIRA
jgi:hypothetical protein